MNDELTTRLSRQLHDQVDGWHDTPLTLEGVQGRARTIRRRRQALATGGVAAAVLAVAIPVGVGLGGNDRSAPQPVNPSPTRVVDEPPTPRSDGTFRLTTDAEEGPVPTTGYLVPDDEAYVDADGTHPLPGRFLQLLPYGDGWVGQRSVRVGDGERIEAVELDAGFAEVRVLGEGLELGLVGNTDGTRVAWVEGGDGDWFVVNAEADGGTIRSAAAPSTTVQGYLSDDRVAVSTTDPDTGEVRHGEAIRAGVSGSTALEGRGEAAPAFQDVRGVSQASGLVAGQTEFRGDSTCSQVREIRPPVTVVAETCDYALGPFSPDGRWIIGYASYYDYGSPTLAILDAFTLEPVVEFRADRRQPSATVQQAAWEDDETVVAMLEQGGEQVVVTAHSDGRLEVVSPPVRVRELSLLYLLPGALLGQN